MKKEKQKNIAVSVSEEDHHDIQDVLDGSEFAYTSLVRRYENDIAKQMWRFTRNPETLKCLVHDVFVEAYISLDTFRGNSPFLHWLRCIATRVGYRHWKRMQKEKRIEEDQNVTNIKRFMYSSQASPSEAAEYAFYLLQRLPVNDRLVLTLLYLESCSVEEIAAQTGWSKTNVKVKAWRARKHLAALLEKEGFSKNHG